MKILFGIAIGIGLVFSVFWVFRKAVSPYYLLSVPKFITDTTKKSYSIEDLNNLRVQSLALEEKLASTNKRIDDLLIFGGIIITLLLAINVGVFVNAQREVDKHLKENFENHKTKILGYLAEVEETVGRAKAELELVQDLRKNAEPITTPTQ